MWENVHFYACSLVSLDFILLAANLRVTIGLRPPPTAPYPPPTPQDRRKTPPKSSRPTQRRSGRTPRPPGNLPRTPEEHRMRPKIPHGSEIGAPTAWEPLALRPFLRVGAKQRTRKAELRGRIDAASTLCQAYGLRTSSKPSQGHSLALYAWHST